MMIASSLNLIGLSMFQLAPLVCILIFIASAAQAEPHKKTAYNTVKPATVAFQPGERFTYNISWSNFFQAGTSVMEVRGEETAEGRPVYRIVSTTRSSAFISAFFPVMDVVQSVLDAKEICSLSYSVHELHGKKKRQREMVFDHEQGTVRIVTNGKEEMFTVTGRVQDALSSLYYLRTRDDFTPGKPITIEVHDGGKNWSVEVQTLGRETIKTTLGEFKAIKVRTFPKYEGVFQHKGEIFIWLTDDARKIPVLMKSTITIGSIVATLTEMQAGENKK